MIQIIKFLFYIFPLLSFSQNTDMFLEKMKEPKISKIKKKISSKNRKRINLYNQKLLVENFELYQFFTVGRNYTYHRIYGNGVDYRLISKNYSDYSKDNEKNNPDFYSTKIEVKKVEKFKRAIDSLWGINNVEEIFKKSFKCLDGSTIYFDALTRKKGNNFIHLASTNCRNEREVVVKIETIFKSIFFDGKTTLKKV